MYVQHDDAGGLHGPMPTWGEIVEINPSDVKTPFAIRRVYWLFDTDAHAVRGKHSHLQLKQLITCPVGSVTVSLEDKDGKQGFVLDSPTKGLTVGPSTWRELYDFSPGAVVVVFASQPYDESDYIRNYDEFLRTPHL